MAELGSKVHNKRPPFSVNITEVIEPQYPRALKFDGAIKKEIKGLLKKKNMENSLP